MVNNYETVFILNPVLSEQQTKDTVEKFRGILANLGANILHEKEMGLRNLAYPIQNKLTGFYYLIEFSADPKTIATLETEYRRDEKVMRFLTTSLDKHALDYNERKRKGLVGKKPVETPAE
jgi:small subunit ribosomal protein S6